MFRVRDLVNTTTTTTTVPPARHTIPCVGRHSSPNRGGQLFILLLLLLLALFHVCTRGVVDEVSDGMPDAVPYLHHRQWFVLVSCLFPKRSFPTGGPQGAAPSRPSVPSTEPVLFSLSPPRALRSSIAHRAQQAARGAHPPMMAKLSVDVISDTT